MKCGRAEKKTYKIGSKSVLGFQLSKLLPIEYKFMYKNNLRKMQMGLDIQGY